MKIWHKEMTISRRGAGILLAMAFLGIGITTVVLSFNRRAIGYYGATRTLVDGYRAKELARAGLEASLLTLRTIPEKFLFTFGLVANTPRILLNENCNEEGACIKYYVSYSIEPEDGKFNLNHLVKIDDQPYELYRDILSRLFDTLELDPDIVGAIIDWIDINNFESIGGAEEQYYNSLEPPRKIKNAPLYSLSELCVVKGFSHPILYEPRVPADFLEERERSTNLSNLNESSPVQESDWILANNVTVYLPKKLLGTEKLNVNVTPYHVLKSLSEVMSQKEVSAIFKLKSQQEGYIDNVDLVKKLPELQIPSGLQGISLGQDLVGQGGTSGWLDTKSRFYRLEGVGYIAISTDNNEKMLASRKIWGIWDKNQKSFIYFSDN